ncbi:hypothetical protein GPALN_014396 [Globodera pallida]|nr:hypothetical protein GPALN_014396 [Globodera pallida]
MVRSSSRPRRPIKRYVDELNDASACNKKVRRTLPPPRIFGKASAGSPLQGKFVSSISSFIKSTAAGAEKTKQMGRMPGPWALVMDQLSDPTVMIDRWKKGPRDED